MKFSIKKKNIDFKTINSDQLQTVEENSKVNENLVESKKSNFFGEHKIPMVKKVLHKKLFRPPFMTRIDNNRPFRS